MLSSKEANLASSRNTASSHVATPNQTRSRRHPLNFMPLQPPAGRLRPMGKKRGHAGLRNGPHIVEFLFLALQRRFQKLLDLHAIRCMRARPDAQSDPVPEVKDNQNGQQTLEDPSPPTLHIDSHPTLKPGRLGSLTPPQAITCVCLNPSFPHEGRVPQNTCSTSS